MRDVAADRPFIIFTSQYPTDLPGLRQRLVDSNISYKELRAIGNEAGSENPVFLVDFAHHDYVRKEPKCVAYLAGDAFKICSLHCKIPEVGPEVEVIGTMEPEPFELKYEDALYRFRDGDRYFVIR